MKYCWDHVDGMMEYRLNLGFSLQPMKWYLLDFSRYLGKVSRGSIHY